MKTITAYLLAAGNGEESYALRLAEDPPGEARAKKGMGHHFSSLWSVELESLEQPQWQEIDWDTVLERIIEAYRVGDTVLHPFQWPLRLAV